MVITIGVDRIAILAATSGSPPVGLRNLTEWLWQITLTTPFHPDCSQEPIDDSASMIPVAFSSRLPCIEYGLLFGLLGGDLGFQAHFPLGCFSLPARYSEPLGNLPHPFPRDADFIRNGLEAEGRVIE
ncbi:MAG: hypothetical protein V1790_17450 [Planctomycetota bacterium]